MVMLFFGLLKWAMLLNCRYVTFFCKFNLTFLRSFNGKLERIIGFGNPADFYILLTSKTGKFIVILFIWWMRQLGIKSTLVLSPVTLRRVFTIWLFGHFRKQWSMIACFTGNKQFVVNCLISSLRSHPWLIGSCILKVLRLWHWFLQMKFCRKESDRLSQLFWKVWNIARWRKLKIFGIILKDFGCPNHCF